MCYSNPAKSLDLARERMTPEQWAKFEADFEHFCAYSGLADRCDRKGRPRSRQAWAKWAYLCGKGL